MVGSFIEIKRNSLCKSVTIDCSRSYHHACGKRLKIDERVNVEHQGPPARISS